MTFSNKEIQEFGSKLTSLGGRLGFDSSPSDQYLDLEEFFLDATRFVFADERLARCIENWVRTYGFVIGPSKLKRIIEKENYQYDPAVFGVFLRIVGRNEKQLNLKLLEKFCKKKSHLTYRSAAKVKARPSDYDPDWMAFNIATQQFVDESKKNLLNFEYTLNHCPELRNRIETGDIVSADYKSYLQREGQAQSLNAISKRIHAHYSNLHKFYTRFEKFGVHSRLAQQG